MIKKKRIIKKSPSTIHKKSKTMAPTPMEYIVLFNTCEVKEEKVAEVDKIIDEKVIVNRSRYEGISSLVKLGNNSACLLNSKPLFQSSYIPFFDRFSAPAASGGNSSLFNLAGTSAGGLNLNNAGKTYNFSQGNFVDGNNTDFSKDIFSGSSLFSSGSAVPWYFIACVHYLECSFSFKKHLHNGDPLTGYTVHVPVHRPKVGHAPPFTFEESAVDAIKLMKYDQVTNWSLPFILQKLEGYNGFGYNKKGVHTPYLWSYSNHYSKGKYVKDGVFDASAVSQQLGAAVILKRMEQRGLISIPRN
jgi:lysozyme family protein